MQANRSRDTAPEGAVRRLVHGYGLRYRVAQRPIPGLRRTADLVFRRTKVAVFVDGCFWHGCPIHGTLPKVNSDYWIPKLARNVERDRETDARLRREGWLVVRIWEHEDPAKAALRVRRAVERRAAKGAG